VIKKWHILISVFLLLVVTIGILSFKGSDERILSYTVDARYQTLQFFWKDDKGHILNNFPNLKNYLHQQHKQLVFAMNGGMFKEDYSPLGLYIDSGKLLNPINKANGYGNFYLKPNGVFYITKSGIAGITSTDKFVNKGIRYATQSGPMLIVDGAIHPLFTKASKNVNIRNGVGILPDGKILFAISKQEINLYDFAKYFRDAGCKNALYLDGFVSRIYLPGKNRVDMDGRFGVMIAVMK
jgi:uncharacterized protein YigE (DUF2233 family)